MLDDFFDPVETVELSPSVSDEVKRTTCFMCAGRCGIKVHLKDGQIRYIEGDRDHPVNRGALCAKGAAGIMNHYSPARLTGPLKRVGAGDGVSRSDGGLAIDATVPLALKEHFTRARYPVDEIDFSKWFSDAEIRSMHEGQSPYFRYKAKTGYV